jgi:hypothetical protein
MADDSTRFDSSKNVEDEQAQELRDIQEQRAKWVGTHGEARLKAIKNSILITYSNNFKKACFGQLMKAFTKWSLTLPLHQMCDDLSKGLKERNSTLEGVRTAYLRDVISIKYNLDQVANFQIDSGKVAASQTCESCKEQGITCIRKLAIKDDLLYSLDSLPSLDLKFLVEKARNSPAQTSSQMKENLIDAGLLDWESGGSIKPWEEGKQASK